MGIFKKVKKAFKATTTGAVDHISTAISFTSDQAKALPAQINTGQKAFAKGLVAADTAALDYYSGGAFSGLGGGRLLDKAAGTNVNAPPEQQEQEQPMGSFLGGLQGVLGTLGSSGGNVGAIATIGSGFLSGFLPARGPSQNQQVSYFPQVQAQPVMAMTPMIRGAASAVAGFAAPLLAKMSLAIGKNVTLRAAMIIIRRLGKYLQSPSAIGAAIGLSVSELSQLITAASLAGSHGRRMNAGNVKALRRAHRRIRSFHKLCGDNDRLKAPRRRAPARRTVVQCN